MVSVADVVGLLVILGVNSAAAALLTRFFRVRLETKWGSALYAAMLSPVVLLVTTLFLGGFLGLGPDLGSRIAVVGIAIVFPMALGISFDYFWMPSPDEVDLPEQYTERDRETRTRSRR